MSTPPILVLLARLAQHPGWGWCNAWHQPPLHLRWLRGAQAAQAAQGGRDA